MEHSVLIDAALVNAGCIEPVAHGLGAVAIESIPVHVRLTVFADVGIGLPGDELLGVLWATAFQILKASEDCVLVQRSEMRSGSVGVDQDKLAAEVAKLIEYAALQVRIFLEAGIGGGEGGRIVPLEIGR